jgi:hypothetical protein
MAGKMVFRERILTSLSLEEVATDVHRFFSVKRRRRAMESERTVNIAILDSYHRRTWTCAYCRTQRTMHSLFSISRSCTRIPSIVKSSHKLCRKRSR